MKPSAVGQNTQETFFVRSCRKISRTYFQAAM
jgi:hypothetical protein